MKKILKLTLVVAAVLCSTTVFAQKLARVNTQEIFAVMPETKEMQQNLDAFGKELQEQLEAIQVEFNNRYAEFQQIAQQDFSKKQQELAAPIQDKLDAAIAKVAKAAGYAAVFDAMMFVYTDAAQVVDINAAVKKELGITDAPAQ